MIATDHVVVLVLLFFISYVRLILKPTDVAIDLFIMLLTKIAIRPPRT